MRHVSLFIAITALLIACRSSSPEESAAPPETQATPGPSPVEKGPSMLGPSPTAAPPEKGSSMLDPSPDPSPVTAPTTAPADEPTATLPEAWWTEPDTHCPEGTHLKGGPPPEEHAVLCVDDEKKWSRGPATYFHKESGKRKREGRHAIVPVEGKDRDEIRRVGLWQTWSETGQLLEEQRYNEQGLPHGTFKEWSPEGTLLGSFIMNGGEGIWRTWHPGGELRSEGPMRGGERVGTWTSYHVGGQKSRVVHYDDQGEEHGTFEVFLENGKEKLTGSYNHGDQSGVWLYRDDNGVTQREVRFSEADDRRTVFYYQDGKRLGQEAPACGLPEDAPEGVKTAFAHDPDTRNRCVFDADAFPGFVVVGSFAHDRGCRPTHYVLDCKLYEKPPTQALLERVGWKEATPESRKGIVERYIEQVSVAMRGRISRDKGFDIQLDETTGHITVDYWVQRPSGMRREAQVDHLKYAFSPEGERVSAP